MNLEKIFLEEDLFPREFVSYEEREYGLLFYDETNKDSYDYILVSKEARRIGVARALMNALVECCKEQGIRNCSLWPAGESAERIYLEAGFRTVAVKKAGRAAMEKPF